MATQDLVTQETQETSEGSLPIHHRILRYRPGQRVVHWLLATSFLLLLLTGLPLLWQPLGFLAAGGYTRLIHRIAAVGFMLVPVLYLLVDRRGARELLVDSFHYTRDDLEWLKHAYRYFMGHAAEMPPQGRLNAGQKLHHAGVVIMSFFIVATGLVLWLAKDQLGANGLAITAMIHDLSMFVLTVLLIGHLYFTYVYQALPAMLSGYVDEEEAYLEYPKWVEEILATMAEEKQAKRTRKD